MAMPRAVEITQEGSFIPASQRPDGSWRKARRVKDGYVPQEEVPLYESKGKQWANSRSSQYPVGMNPSDIKAKEETKLKAKNIPGLVIENGGKKKKKKKKSGDKDINEENKNKMTDQSTLGANCLDEWQTVQYKSAKTTKFEPVTSGVDPSKRLKTLKKKLREIEAIEEKIASSEIKKPEKDQLEKVHRKADVLSEILALELILNQ